jgi:hypothetical protein
VTKRPEDCFTCFNRTGPKRNYSKHQFPVDQRLATADNYSRIIRELAETGRKSQVSSTEQVQEETRKTIDNYILETSYLHKEPTEGTSISGESPYNSLVFKDLLDLEATDQSQSSYYALKEQRNSFDAQE